MLPLGACFVQSTRTKAMTLHEFLFRFRSFSLLGRIVYCLLGLTVLLGTTTLYKGIPLHAQQRLS